MFTWIIASLHLIGLVLAFAALRMRASLLRSPLLDDHGLTKVFRADLLWGLAAALLIATGLERAFGGIEKGRDYYLHNPMFHLKMTCLALVLVLEIWPMTTLLAWRTARRRHQAIVTTRARLIARISDIQTLLLLIMICAATAMARFVHLPTSP
jgi:putative membrane protein